MAVNGVLCTITIQSLMVGHCLLMIQDPYPSSWFNQSARINYLLKYPWPSYLRLSKMVIKYQYPHCLARMSAGANAPTQWSRISTKFLLHSSSFTPFTLFSSSSSHHPIFLLFSFASASFLLFFSSAQLLHSVSPADFRSCFFISATSKTTRKTVSKAEISSFFFFSSSWTWVNEAVYSICECWQFTAFSSDLLLFRSTLSFTSGEWL